jgi:hypothetical protein
VRGAPVWFEASKDLWIKASPYLIDAGGMMVELRFFEGAASSRREIGWTGCGAQITNPRQPTLYGGGRGGTVIYGRRGYGVMSSCTATYE